MKICIVSGGAYSLFNSSVKFRTGGAEKQLYYLGKELSRNEGVDVCFVVGDCGQNDVEEYDGIKVYKLISGAPSVDKKTEENSDGHPKSGKSKGFFYSVISAALTFLRKVKSAIWVVIFLILSLVRLKKVFDYMCYGVKLFRFLKHIKADMYIGSTTNACHFFNVLHCRLYKKKFLYRLAHDCEVSYDGNRKFFDWFTALSMELTYKFSDFITFQSDDQRDMFLKNRKIKHYDIMKNIFFFKNDDNTVKDYKGGFLWVGRCERWKRPELYLDIAERFPDETFTMICPKADRKEEFWESIKSRALGIKNLKFYDFVNNHEIYKFYREAKIFLITSDIEGFSNTMMEAMSERCPVVSLNVNPGNIIGNYNLGICAGGDYKRYAAEIDILRKDAAKCREYGNNGYEYLKSEHEAVSITAKLFENIKNILK